MQKQNAQITISDDEFSKLIGLARQGNESAMGQIINLYQNDIQQSCKYIKENKEDTYQSIITDFIDLIINDHSIINL